MEVISPTISKSILAHASKLQARVQMGSRIVGVLARWSVAAVCGEALCASCEFIQQRLSLLQVARVKTLGEPAVDLSEQLVGFGTLLLALPQPGEAHGRSQFQGLRLLAAGNGKGVAKTGFRLRVVLRRACQQ